MSNISLLVHFKTLVQLPGTLIVVKRRRTATAKTALLRGRKSLLSLRFFLFFVLLKTKTKTNGKGKRPLNLRDATREGGDRGEYSRGIYENTHPYRTPLALVDVHSIKRP